MLCSDPSRLCGSSAPRQALAELLMSALDVFPSIRPDCLSVFLSGCLLPGIVINYSINVSVYVSAAPYSRSEPIRADPGEKSGNPPFGGACGQLDRRMQIVHIDMT